MAKAKNSRIAKDGGSAAREEPAPATAKPIWAKRRAGSSVGEAEYAAAAARALDYCAGRDVAARPPADAELIPYDIMTNRAHCKMLAECGIIDAKTGKAISRGLDTIEKRWKEGKFNLDPQLEDVHINIERAVAEIEGEAVAGVMHTARSRNDQASTDVRLWLRDKLVGRVKAISALVETLAKFASEHTETIAPGWTHGQPAMPTTLGHWAAAHAWGLSRDAEALIALWPLINQCPLGSAASFGTSWPIDRERTAALLGFDAPSPNSLDAITTRWESEARLGSTLAIMMTHLAALAQDLIFLSSPPRNCLRLGDAHVTGSSIMPQKRNPDFAEVTRARALVVHGLASNLTGVCRGLLSGYNRDTQWTKYWIMDLLYEVGEAPEVFKDAIEQLTVNEEALAKAATEGFSLAADLADYLARTRKLPFRKAYHVIAEAAQIDESAGKKWFRAATLNAILERDAGGKTFTEAEVAAAGDAKQVLAERRSLGGPAPADVKAQTKELTVLAKAQQSWMSRIGRKVAP